ncbi:TIGR03885 family FMN-dependent LLM class oxidoreductase [Desertivirga xinjiangensis]|uniref:TIGR03885 family FMN-dependent LLM class oxidoreductase n=1 Tax=Desertivirga xinjiangensis TaxID=539206 RepID=UPI00210D0AD5|nr:TIGR03885 family FMN-dependent LLM class oxidoreductase [Pedobacter xinjiangensis]
MISIGYHASHEQFKPSELMKLVQLAEKAGFTSINSSDHFHPWSERQGQSGYAFSWLGAAMQCTSIPFGVVCAPGQRNHPAIVAQAAATLAEMFPNRFWISVGSGEALNEQITGDKWPDKTERNARLLECVNVMRDLFAGKTVNHDGLIRVENARLYTLPSTAPLIIGAAVTKETAAWVGSWADGLITVSKPENELKETVEAFRNNGGEGKPMYLKTQLSYSRYEEAALSGAYDQWRTNIFQGTVLADMPTTAHYDAIAEFVRPEDVAKMVRISSDLNQHLEWIEKDIELGFDKIILHNVNREQELFIRDFGENVLPKIRI